MPGCFGRHRLERDVGVRPDRQCCRAAPPGFICLAHRPARLTQLIPLAARDSCQTVPAFWSLPAQARFKPVSCGWPWISSSLPPVTFPLFCKLEFMLLGRWCWCWRRWRGGPNPERREGELTSPTGLSLESRVGTKACKIQTGERVWQSL